MNDTASTPLPGRAHAHAGDTEQAAADAASITSGRIRGELFYLLQIAEEEGLTDEELTTAATEAGITSSRTGVGARRNELVSLGLVRDSGLRRLSSFGRGCIVWVVAA